VKKFLFLIIFLLITFTHGVNAQTRESEIKADVFLLGEEVWLNGDIYSGSDLLYGVDLQIVVIDPGGITAHNITFTTKIEEERSGSEARKQLGFELPLWNQKGAANGTWLVTINFEGNEAFDPTSFEGEITLPLSIPDLTEPEISEPDKVQLDQSVTGGIPGFPFTAILVSLVLFRIIREPNKMTRTHA